jgi:tRNA A-37 threonylcarbamoyl transferase component Bud32
MMDDSLNNNNPNNSRNAFSQVIEELLPKGSISTTLIHIVEKPVYRISRTGINTFRIEYRSANHVNMRIFLSTFLITDFILASLLSHNFTPSDLNIFGNIDYVKSAKKIVWPSDCRPVILPSSDRRFFREFMDISLLRSQGITQDAGPVVALSKVKRRPKPSSPATEPAAAVSLPTKNQAIVDAPTLEFVMNPTKPFLIDGTRTLEYLVDASNSSEPTTKPLLPPRTSPIDGSGLNSRQTSNGEFESTDNESKAWLKNLAVSIPHKLTKVESPKEIGPYTVLGVLGIGGMGTAYLAQDILSRNVVIKQMLNEHARIGSLRARFHIEARALLRAYGTGIPRVVDMQTSAEQPWFATEYAPSLDLGTAVKVIGSLPERLVTRITRDLLEIVIRIHGMKMVHRDIKPSNILLTEDGRASLIDFGISREDLSERLTETGVVVGSQEYMAPERLSGNSGGPAGDVFAIACTFVHLLRGRSPYVGPSGNLHVARMFSEDPDLSNISAQTAETIRLALTANPDERISAENFLGRLGN